MAREKFSERELTEAVGVIPGIDCGLTFSDGSRGIPDEQVFYRPISPRENFKLFFQGKVPYWIPSNGKMRVDIQGFRPRLYADNVVMHMIFDGSGPYVYDSLTKTGLFDLDWEFVPSAGGATVHPGNPKVKDITRWEEYIRFPNMDEWDWDTCERDNQSYLNTDKLRQLGIPSGFWERLMALYDVDNAAIALIDEDEQIGVHRLFDKLAEFHIDYINRVNARCEIDSVLMHDDWGHQNSTFFSEKTAREMVAPYLKRVIDHCHSLGLYFELHCCGKCETMVPVFIDIGIDLWCGQTINDYDMLLEKYKDAPIAYGVNFLPPPPNPTPEQIREAAKAWVDKYKGKRVVQFFLGAPKGYAEAVYEFSRKAYENEA